MYGRRNQVKSCSWSNESIVSATTSLATDLKELILTPSLHRNEGEKVKHVHHEHSVLFKQAKKQNQ